MRGHLIKIAAVMVALLCGAASAQAANPLPTYTSPDYDGATQVPPTKPLPPPKAIPLSAAGTFPSAIVDAAGTAHVVWNEARGDQADAAVYCRIKRGASGCDSTTTLVPTPHYGTNDGPQYDIDNGGPKIMQVGNQLVIVSYRYPTGFLKPNGAGTSGGVVEWVSGDGGTTWSGGGLAAAQDVNGGAVGFAVNDIPRIATISQEGYCGTCVGQIKGGAYDGASANIGSGSGIPDANYDGGLVVDNGLPAAAFSDLSHNSYLRRWTGTEPLTDPNTWAPPIKVANADEPSIASGPAGLYMMTRTPLGTTSQSVRKIGATAASAATRITPKDVNTAYGKLAEDPSGNLIAGWVQQQDHGDDKAGLHLSNAAGAAFGGARLQIPGTNVGQIALAATDDGGGFAIANQSGGVNSVGNIVATGFGTPEPTNKAGLGALPGGAGDVDQKCDKVSFGAVKVSADNKSCFLNGVGQFSDVSVTEGTIDLNGLKLVPDPGSKIVLDPKHHTVYTSGPIKVLAVTPELTITLWHGPIKIEVPDDGPGDPLFSFDTSKFGVDVGGFGVSGKIDVILTPDGVRIPISLKLPAYLGNVTGAAELIAKTGTGLELSSLRLHAGPIPIGPIFLDSVDVSYQSAGDVWDGSASLKFPPAGALQASVEFKMGNFNGAAFDYTPPAPGITIGPAVFLTKVGGSFKLDPLHIGIDGTIGAGGAINGVSPVSVDGHFDLDVPDNGPFTLTGRGDLAFTALHVADATIKYVSSGYATFNAHIGLDLPLVTLTGDLSGFADGRNLTYGAQGAANVCVGLDPLPYNICVDGALAISPAGLAACAGFKIPVTGKHITAGVELPFKPEDAVAFTNPALATAVILSHVVTPCHTSAFVPKPPSARAAQAGVSSVQIPAGLPTATVLLVGQSGAPDVTVTGPGGMDPGQSSQVLRTRGPGLGGAYVVLDKPRAGTWTFTSVTGSAPITDVQLSTGYVGATVKATLGGRARDRTLSYKIANNGSGQTVTFVEKAKQSTRVLGTTSKASGTIKFGTGTDLPAGKRTVIALIQHDHLTTDRVKVGSYVAPGPPKLAKTTGVKVVKTSKSKVRISWKKVVGADHYEVRARGTHGMRRLFITKKTKVSVTGLAPGDKITATVRAVSAGGRRGAVSS